jgi:SdrD B-like domain
MSMSQEVRQTELREKTQQLLHGRLKHVAAAGLAAALLPLAAVTVSTAEGQICSSAGMVCGFVWNDTNNNGIQDAGETGIQGAVVTLNGVSTATDQFGFYEFSVAPGTYDISVQIPPGTQASPANVGSNDAVDSDGVADGLGNSVATVTLAVGQAFNSSTDFGFSVPPVAQPGTGTPGYWKNHPDAWPVQTITIGGVTYTKDQAIGWLMDGFNKDKTVTMFSSLVSAKLNVLVGNDSSCVSSTITQADQWMATYGPVGSKVAASSLAWKIGEPLHRLMDNYNNGMLCAPHRD